MNLRKGYFLDLGGNGSRDRWSFLEHRGPRICQCAGHYEEMPVVDRVLLYELIDELSKIGIDLIVLDVLDAMEYKSHPEI